MEYRGTEKHSTRKTEAKQVLRDRSRQRNKETDIFRPRDVSTIFFFSLKHMVASEDYDITRVSGPTQWPIKASINAYSWQLHPAGPTQTLCP